MSNYEINNMYGHWAWPTDGSKPFVLQDKTQLEFVRWSNQVHRTHSKGSFIMKTSDGIEVSIPMEDVHSYSV